MVIRWHKLPEKPQNGIIDNKRGYNMVDLFGNWTYVDNTPEVHKCDYDRIADWIVNSGYKIKTSLDNLVKMIFVYFDSPDNTDYGEFTIEGCKCFVFDNGGLAEFDYTV